MEALEKVSFNSMLFSRPTSGTRNRTSSWFISNEFVIFSLFCLSIGISVLENQQANSQTIPVLPPIQHSESNLSSFPIIEVLTSSLTEGDNVFRVKITDESPIKKAQITFVQNGQFVVGDLVRDPNRIYKALIKAHGPTAVVVTSVVDANEKTASVVKYLNVTPNTVLAQITNFFAGIGKSIVSIFGPAHNL